jgi:hypothetical protein
MLRSTMRLLTGVCLAQLALIGVKLTEIALDAQQTAKTVK